jgi:hypothetical protein
MKMIKKRRQRVKKDEILRQIRDARKAHISWVQRAKALVMGVPLSEDQIPVDVTQCLFGKWFYDEGMRLKKLPGFEIMDDIERYHLDLHEEYLKIFRIFFGKKAGILDKLLPFFKKKVTPEERQHAKIILADLEKTSQNLLDALFVLERRVEALQEEAFRPL